MRERRSHHVAAPRVEMQRSAAPSTASFSTSGQRTHDPPLLPSTNVSRSSHIVRSASQNSSHGARVSTQDGATSESAHARLTRSSKSAAVPRSSNTSAGGNSFSIVRSRVDVNASSSNSASTNEPRAQSTTQTPYLCRCWTDARQWRSLSSLSRSNCMPHIGLLSFPCSSRFTATRYFGSVSTPAVVSTPVPPPFVPIAVPDLHVKELASRPQQIGSEEL
mmetsp:Transcript_13350/g.40388  ORF Transcript_13350/g.40388 Transcript_13350/m.40388 type:complete len:220 (-) Transcript_13350:1556-2215(-)